MSISFVDSLVFLNVSITKFQGLKFTYNMIFMSFMNKKIIIYNCTFEYVNETGLFYFMNNINAIII